MSLKKTIKELEEKVVLFQDLEKKIRKQKIKYEERIKDIEAKYREKVSYLTKKLNKALQSKDNNRIAEPLTFRDEELYAKVPQKTDRVVQRTTSAMTERKLEYSSNHGLEKKIQGKPKKSSEVFIKLE